MSDAPDRIRTCDLMLRRHPERGGGDHPGQTEAKQTLTLSQIDGPRRFAEALYSAAFVAAMFLLRSSELIGQ